MPQSDAAEDSDPLEHTTRALAAGAKSDREWFTRLYARVAPSVYAWARLRLTAALRKVLDLEDVVQEVWCRALDGLATYDPARSSFRTWVFGIANHVVLKGYRQLGKAQAARAGEREIAEIPDDVTSISQRVARNETLERCIERLAALAEDERNLVIHCGLEGLSAADAARILGASPEAVAKRWQRLRARLREVAPFKDLLAP
jgi:RNA polymerase sigma-70 factor (ECF subfamily)